MTQAEGSGSATIRRDDVSFTEPYRDARDEALNAWKTASDKVRGAEARTKAAALAIKQLMAFNDEIGRRLKEQSFDQLPKFRTDDSRLEAMRVLNVGPYRGVFIVRPDGTEVIALVFSKEPHDLGNRVAEIGRSYIKSGGALCDKF